MVNSLKVMALVKVTIIMFQDPSFLHLELKEKHSLSILPNKNWVHLIKRKIPSFSCPISLQKEVIGLVRPISAQISEWRVDHSHIFYLDIFKITNFCWTDSGTINRLETAKILVQCPDFTITQRFALAICYWLVKDMRTLWEAKFTTESHIPKENSDESLWKGIIHEITTLLEKGIEDYLQATFLTKLLLYNSLQNQFQYELLEYTQNDLFSKLLTAKEGRDIVIHILKNEWSLYYISVWFSKMGIKRQKIILKKAPYGVLKMLLHWPLQIHFMEKVNSIWFRLKKRQFLGLLHIIICQKIIMEWNDFEYIYVLKEFWNCSPVSFKKYVKQKNIYRVLKKILINAHTKPYPEKYLLHSKNNISNFTRCSDYTSKL
ncbi:uncharacterized protein TNIN_126971 [Trichonephila inaurata madagascariensis]|uniref:Uncharacterized protein n=1 Tax=Trichonephila inaurata madagascariensis TaxID=2747483 RepID=A0A8X7BVQ4_9ARAC|nr:uncharacterized protein TNIN_126971 [Trichonephila inaurata madagascariensis]